jgi:predicted O-methyltransferase YrrM
MLHADVLTLLYHFGSYSTGNILELGPFVGGSTIALGWGVRDSARKCQLVTVEVGGSFNHPTMGSTDIIGSLHSNLQHQQVQELVTVVEGNSREQGVVARINKMLPQGSVGLFVVDSDGLVLDDFEIYHPLLADGAYMIVDDYFCPGNMEKGARTKRDLDVLEERGLIETLGVFGWGTWVGRLKKTT